MPVIIDMPKELEDSLRRQWGGDLSRAAKEALAVESYRSGKISIGFLAHMLGMGVVEAQEWLSRRNVPLNYGLDDLEVDRKTLSDLFGVKL
jgi:predicted HTH domain antitoxin